MQWIVDRESAAMFLARIVLICFFAFCFGCRMVPPGQLQTFSDAQSSFDAGDYRQSARLYEELIESGIRSGTVYYNLGNAWAKADDPVRAVAAYYSAKQYIPNDPQLNANWQAVSAKNGGTVPVSERSLFGTVFFWQDSIGRGVKTWCSLFLSVLTASAGLIYLLRPASWLKQGAIGGIILSAIAIVSTGYDWYRFEYTERVIVTENVLPLKGNSEQYEPAFISPIPFGTSAIVLDNRNGWYSLRFPSGQEGWLPQKQTFRLE